MYFSHYRDVLNTAEIQDTPDPAFLASKVEASAYQKMIIIHKDGTRS